MAKAKVTLPPQLWFLLNGKQRYKCCYGGRASAKSTSFAKALLITAATNNNLRILCCREIQNSIEESVYRLLVGQLKKMGVEADFEWTKTSLRCTKTGSEFFFRGLRTDVDKVKSMEKVNICWVEEADKVSDDSWEVLIPTIREPGSQIWITWNTGSEDDAVYRRFVLNQPPDCVVQKLNYVDIPKEWLSTEILAEAEYCRVNDPSGYDHIWLGNPGGVGGLVWSCFDKNIHTKDFSWDEIRLGAECFMSMDPHSKYFPFCLWVARFPISRDQHTYWIYNEWPGYELYGKYYSEFRQDKFFTEWGGTAELAQQIFALDETARGLKVRARFIDTRFSKGAGGENWSTGTQGIISELGKVNLVFQTPAEKFIDVQRETIIEALRYNRSLPIGAFNTPTLFVAPWCRNMLQSLQFHRTADRSEKELPRLKDASDALRICFAGMSRVAHGGGVEKQVVEPWEQYHVSYQGAGSWMT